MENVEYSTLWLLFFFSSSSKNLRFTKNIYSIKEWIFTYAEPLQSIS